MNHSSTIRDINLAPAGQNKIDWVKGHMPVLNAIYEDFSERQPFAGLKVTMCLHLEAKTAYLALTLQAGGARVVVAASNPLSTQDDVVAALVKNGVEAHAWYGATDEEYASHLELALEHGPDYVIDDGADLVHLLHTKRQDLLGNVKGGAEETTTGILRLKGMAADNVLRFPMIAVNDARSKFLFDNRYGTGQSVWDSIMRTTNLVVAGKTVCVVGYGWCGKGVAMRAKGMGARVVACEIDPVKANEAWMDGFQVMTAREAAEVCDVFITVTGNCKVIGAEHYPLMKDGAILANAGHFDVEIDKKALSEQAVAVKKIKPNIEEFSLPSGRRIHLLAEGRLVNLAAGDGHPVEVMDMSFGLQALALEYVAGTKNLPGGVYPVPCEIDDKVASMHLDSLGIKIDRLTQEQETYLSGWQA